jgi:5-methylcytosine-specific restriction enzyme subunit McrC
MIIDKGIRIKNIYYMLSYAFELIKHSGYSDMDTEEFENIHDLFAAILAHGLTHQLKHGLYKEYIHKNDNLTTIRGKINIVETIRNKILQRYMVNCEFDELSEDNIYNQIIRSTIALLLRHGKINSKNKSRLKQNLFFLSNVRDINLKTVKWNTLTFSRNSQNYKILINICHLLVSGLLLTTEHGTVKLATFIDEKSFDRLYEKFILEYYKQEFGHVIKSEASQINWILDNDNNDLLPIMRTDVTLTQKNKNKQNILIIDAKYYGQELSNKHYSDKSTLHSSNLYQIFTYVKNKEAALLRSNIPHKVSGMLLYAKTSEQIVLDNTYQMSGNTICVKNLDLSKDFSEIRNQLGQILHDHFGIEI